MGECEATLGIMQASEHVVAWHRALDQAVRAVNGYRASTKSIKIAR
jgi:hypothetical protein